MAWHKRHRNDGVSSPLVHYFLELPSCLDKAFELIEQGRLSDWDSVLAVRQTQGRGQMRRAWHSLEGNLFAAIKLPRDRAFNTSAASIAIAALFVNGLRSFGCPIMIKWPNDLVICHEDENAKIAGILLEEKKDALVAGIGINVIRAPEAQSMRADAALPADSLAHNCGDDPLPVADELWRLLVKHVFSVYKNGPIFSEIWKNTAEELLLWRGMNVEIKDGPDTVSGRLVCLSESGGVLLETEDGLLEKRTGSMARKDF